MYVEGQVTTGDPDDGRPPVKVAGVDTNGDVQAVQVDTTGALVISGDVTTTGVSDTPAFQDAITGKTLIRNSAGVLGGIYSMYNPNNGQDVFLQVFDAASTGAVTLGSTAPKLSFYIPSLAAYDGSFARPIAFSSGIVVAPTTTYKGSTAPTSGLYGTVAHATS